MLERCTCKRRPYEKGGAGFMDTITNAFSKLSNSSVGRTISRFANSSVGKVAKTAATKVAIAGLNTAANKAVEALGQSSVTAGKTSNGLPPIVNKSLPSIAALPSSSSLPTVGSNGDGSNGVDLSALYSRLASGGNVKKQQRLNHHAKRIFKGSGIAFL